MANVLHTILAYRLALTLHLRAGEAGLGGGGGSGGGRSRGHGGLHGGLHGGRDDALFISD